MSMEKTSPALHGSAHGVISVSVDYYAFDNDSEARRIALDRLRSNYSDLNYLTTGGLQFR
eukprot:m.103181 g.103181  ORF g.103181 m.103181 type:complete len:60 (-) comp13799_c0_seq3:643-822(-)